MFGSVERYAATALSVSLSVQKGCIAASVYLEIWNYWEKKHSPFSWFCYTGMLGFACWMYNELQCCSYVTWRHDVTCDISKTYSLQLVNWFWDILNKAIKFCSCILLKCTAADNMHSHQRSLSLVLTVWYMPSTGLIRRLCVHHFATQGQTWEQCYTYPPTACTPYGTMPRCAEVEKLDNMTAVDRRFVPQCAVVQQSRTVHTTLWKWHLLNGAVYVYSTLGPYHLFLFGIQGQMLMNLLIIHFTHEKAFYSRKPKGR